MKVTADDIARLLASAPPRQVPAQVRRAARGGSGGCVAPLFGLVFAAVGAVFTWVFFPWQFLDDWRLDLSEATAPGVVRTAGDTNMSLNDVKVAEYLVVYNPPGSPERLAVCYSTGRRWGEGEAVRVRYLPDRPEIARIEGARRSKGGGWGALVALFPLAGGAGAGWLFLAWRRTNRLLVDGRVAEVDVLGVEATTMSINYQTIHRVTLSALPESRGQPVVVKRWAKAEVSLLTTHALQKQPIFVLYDPRRPRHLVFPEALIDP